MRFPLWRSKREQDLEKEVKSHIEMSIEERIDRGETPVDAAVRARRQLGNAGHIKEITRNEWGWMWVERFGQDLRYGARILTAGPGFTFVAILTLALGIGANSTIFSFVNSILLRPLPLKNSDRLVEIWEANPQRGISRTGPSSPTFLDWQEQSKSFEDMALFEIGSGTFVGNGEPQQVPAMRVTTNFLTVLGAQTSRGRLFLPEDGAGGRSNVVIITDSFWRSNFSADQDIIGKKANIDGLIYTIVGVLSPQFRFPVAAEGFVPWPNDELRQRPRADHDFGVFGHLKPGVTVQQANAELNTISHNLAKNLRVMEGWNVTVVPFQQVMVEYIRPALLVLLGAVAFVLLIACTNVATLLVARGASRQKEIAVRLALGASRWRLFRQFMTESLLLGVAGGAVGLFIAFWCTGLLRSALPSEIPIPDAGASALLPAVTIDMRVLLFTLIVSLLASVFFGSIPAIVFSRPNPGDAMKNGARGTASGHQRIRSVLVVSEVTLSLVLLVGAGLMIHSFWRLGQVSPGFQPDHLLSLEMELPTDTKYREAPEQAAVFKRMLESARNVPGVKSAALTEIVPLTQRDDSTQFLVDGSASIAADLRIPAQFRAVSARYFATLGIPVLKGREFTDSDNRDAPSVVLIDQSLANLYWPHENPIGQHIKFSASGRPREIVGVVGPVKQEGLDRQDSPMIYAPFTQKPQRLMSLVAKTDSAPESMVNDLKAAIWSVDKDQPVYNIRTMDAIVSETKATPKLSLTLMTVFAGLALLLAAIGIYGVVCYSVTQCTHEIGIRMALGAQTGDVLKLMLGNGMALTFIGVAIGLAASMGLGRIMSTILYGMNGTDFVTLAGVSLLLITVSLVASYIPARRATRVDPMIALRSE